MTGQLSQAISAPLFATSWLAGMLLMIEIGRRVGLRRLARDPLKGMAGQDMTAGAVYALFGLLIAFTFSGAASRLDARRMLIVDEANDLGTAYLRIELLAPEAQPMMRSMLRDYVDSELAAYRKLPDLGAAMAELARAQAMQGRIWSRALAATRDPGAHPDSAKLLLPALNSVFDIGATRAAVARIHPPAIIYALLFIVGMGSGLLAGYRSAESPNRDWTHAAMFALIMGLSIFVILGIEFPRMSFISFENDQLLIDVRDSMK